FDRGRLACAVRAEEPEHLALLDLEADPSDGFELSVGLAEIGDGDCRWHLSGRDVMFYLVDMSSTISLSPTARVILGLIRLGARTGYDIKQTIEVSTRFF